MQSVPILNVTMPALLGWILQRLSPLSNGRGGYQAAVYT